MEGNDTFEREISTRLRNRCVTITSDIMVPESNDRRCKTKFYVEKSCFLRAQRSSLSEASLITTKSFSNNDVNVFSKVNNMNSNTMGKLASKINGAFPISNERNSNLLKRKKQQESVLITVSQPQTKIVKRDL